MAIARRRQVEGCAGHGRHPETLTANIAKTARIVGRSFSFFRSDTMEDEKPSPFADLLTGAVWLALAAAIVIGAWQMDRLSHLQASIYTAPGLVPGLLGCSIGFMAILLMARAVRAGALAQAAWPRVNIADHWRLIAILVLSLGYAIGLIGHGVVFWLASAIYVAVTVFIFQFADRRRDGTLIRGGVIAIAFGIISGLVIHYAFQDLFLVRLP